ncbi:MAG: hypothetical protein C0478_14365 [Planctomyces sp.]|nr:hypothetical protein [Planctomyces sp.]
MIGYVDERLRALVPIRIASPGSSSFQQCWAWGDTAFNGTIVLPRSIAESLDLTMESSADAILANGTIVAMETFRCQLEWFGGTYDTQIVTNEGEYPLLGTMLLVERRLEID